MLFNNRINLCMNQKNIFTDLPVFEQGEIFETLLKNKKITIERIVSAGKVSQETDWYDQESDEWVMILKGRASLSFEHQPTVYLNEGDYIHIPAHLKHKVSWIDPSIKTIWPAIHYLAK